MHPGIRLYLQVSLLFFLFAVSCREQDRAGVRQVATIEWSGGLLGVFELATRRNVPWEICFGPDGKLWFTEQQGRVCRIDPETGTIDTLLQLQDVWFQRTAGLLGMDLFKEGDTIYAFLNYTVQHPAVQNNTADNQTTGNTPRISSKLVRYKLVSNNLHPDLLTEPKLLLEIPGGHSHNGSRVKLSKDGLIYWATGDAHVYSNAQDTNVFNGKILRLNRDGSIPADNPIPGSPVWAWGFRNMQGLTESSTGQWYSSEHGEASDDEVNLLLPKGNYGWPEIEGYTDSEKEIAVSLTQKTPIPPLIAWTPTIAPAGIAYYNSHRIPQWKNSLLLVTLKTQSLHLLTLDTTGTYISKDEIILDSAFGRLRAIAVSDQGEVYIATSNRDWNPSPGFPVPQDDRILKIKPVTEQKGLLIKRKTRSLQQPADGAGLYKQYCASCHKPDGAGVPGIFPALTEKSYVGGRKDSLINLVMKGKAQMPSFSFLSDEDLARVLSFVRKTWSQKSDSITVNNIRTFR